MTIPFTKAHGARNDFLLTWRDDAGTQDDMPAVARAICNRHTGVGADGWLLMNQTADADVAIELWNSDGSTSDLSGNGTRCVAAYLVANDRAGDLVRISTGAGLKHLQLLDRQGNQFLFEMNMGRPRTEELRGELRFESISNDVTILNVGNPQCAVFVADFDFDWRAVGAWLEHHPRFPHRSNVSFIRVVDPHTIDVRFWERGAGETMSSGTGSTGAAAAAFARGLVQSPVEVQTPAGPMNVRWENDEIFLAGPAELIAGGEFYL